MKKQGSKPLSSPKSSKIPFLESTAEGTASTTLSSQSKAGGAAKTTHGNVESPSPRRGRGELAKLRTDDAQSGTHITFTGIERCFMCRLLDKDCIKKVKGGLKKCSGCSGECSFSPSVDSAQQLSRFTAIYTWLKYQFDDERNENKKASLLVQMNELSRVAQRWGGIKINGVKVDVGI